MEAPTEMTTVTSKKTIARAVWLTTLLAYAAVLAYASLSPVCEGSALAATSARRTINNLLHMPAYALLAAIAYVALRQAGRQRHTICKAITAGGVAVAFGGVMELAQAFVPGRWPGLGDILLNTAGAALFVGVVWLLRRGDAQG